MREVALRFFDGLPYFAKAVRAKLAEWTPLMVARPMSVTVSPTKRCNAFCPMCGIGRANARKSVVSTAELSMDQVTSLYDGLAKLGARGTFVSFADGEPTLWKPLAAAVHTGRRLGIDTSLTTNGYTLRGRVADAIIDAEPSNVGISLESVRSEANETLRPLGGKGTQKTIDAIEELLCRRKSKNKKFRVNIKTVITAINYRFMPEIVEKYAAREGVMWTPQPYRGPDKSLWVTDTDSLQMVVDRLLVLKKKGYKINASAENLQNFVDYFASGWEAHGGWTLKDPPARSRQSTANGRRCTIGFTSLFVGVDGQIRLCPYKEPIGKLGDEPLDEMWRGRAAANVRAKIRDCSVDCELSNTRPSSLWHKAKLFLAS